MSHTPGPWVVSEYMDDGKLGVLTNDNGILCSNRNGLTEADAKLIAAAPTLAHFLQFYVDAFPAFRSKPVGAPNSIERRAQQTHADMEDQARAALAKAGL